MTIRSTLFAAALGISTLGFVGCSTDAPDTPNERHDLQRESQNMLDHMCNQDPGLRDFVNNSYGYAIFPSIGKGGLVAGGAFGRGEVYQNGRFIGYVEMNQGTVGAQIGGEEYAELIVFENSDSMRRFQDDEMAFSANASAVALKSGAAKSAKFDNGIAVFTSMQGGLMAEASIGGQKFNYQPKSQVPSHDSYYERKTETTHNPNP